MYNISVILSLEQTVGRLRVTKGRRTSARVRLDKIVQIGGVARLECFVDD